MKNLSGKTGKRITVFTLCVVLVALFATNCEKLRELRVNELAESLSKIPITATDYSLENSDCSWNFAAMTADSVYIINSSTELLPFITGSSPPNIDFGENTLLLVYGNENVSDIAKNVQFISKNKEYKLNMKVLLGDTTIPQQWCAALLVPKIPQNAIVILSMMYSCEDTIPFTVYPFGFAGLKNDSLYVINSPAEWSSITSSPPDTIIDFSNYTLLCIRSWYPYQMYIEDTILLKNYCTDKYTLNVTIYDKGAAMPQVWYLSIIVPKINKTNIISTREEIIDELSPRIKIKYTF